ncbi:MULTISPECIES: NmrA family NAD(P)-binding protein [Rhizobium/Agrobacterium group]|nr:MULTISPECIES: NmrA family NAD(P)-binding protein [Rhizobium/Agrobacterium group]
MLDRCRLELVRPETPQLSRRAVKTIGHRLDHTHQSKASRRSRHRSSHSEKSYVRNTLPSISSARWGLLAAYSVGNELTGVPRFDAKPRIEAHVRQLDMTTTIIRPMIFMEMLLRPGFGLDEGRLVSLIRPDHSIQLIAVEDIGRFVAAVLADKSRFGGATLKIASDRLTGRELEVLLSEASGRPIRYERFPDGVLAANADLAHMAESLEGGPLAEQVDLELMREINPDLLTFRSWLAGSGGRSLDAALSASAS